MKVLKANAKAITIFAAVVIIGGWLIFMSQAADDGGSAIPFGSSPNVDQPDKGNIPRLDPTTPGGSEEPPPRWAATPVPPPGKDGRSFAKQGPVIVPSASSVVIGTEITIRGQGFAPQSEVVLELERTGGHTMTIAEEVPVNRDGTFAIPFLSGVEFLPGEYTIVASGGGGEVRVPLRLLGMKPVAVIDPSAGKPGEELGITGGGFAPGEEVRLYLDTLAAAPFTSVRAGSDGNVAGTFNVPMAAEGEHLLILLGARSGALVPAQFTAIGFYPWVLLSLYASQPEVSIDFEGQNFAPGEEIWVFKDQIGGALVGQASANQEGEFSLLGAYFVPPQLRGDHKFFFFGTASQKVVEAIFTALPYTPAVEPSIYAGKPGNKVSLAGEGFARGETLRAYWGEPEQGVLLGESKAGPDGSFKGWGDLIVPYDADIMQGGANINVVGEVSQARASTWFALVALTPSAELSKYVGPPGETLQFSGNGFAPTEKVIISLAGGDEVLAVAQANDDGSFENAGSFKVPPDQAEELEFVFTGTLSDAQARTHYRIGVPEDDTP